MQGLMNSTDLAESEKGFKSWGGEPCTERNNAICDYWFPTFSYKTQEINRPVADTFLEEQMQGNVEKLKITPFESPSDFLAPAAKLPAKIYGSKQRGNKFESVQNPKIKTGPKMYTNMGKY